MLTRIRDDLWETQAYSPAPGLTTHAFLWKPPSGANVLFYSPGTADDFDEIEGLGGVAHQYLSHQDEAGPALGLVASRFGARLHAPVAELGAIREFAEPHVHLRDRGVDRNGVEVVPTPGHSPGSTCFLVTGAGGSTYLFTGDTVFVSADGVWTAGFIPGVSDAAALESSLRLLSTLEPDLVLSSAVAGSERAHSLGDTRWATRVDQALGTLPATTA